MEIWQQYFTPEMLEILSFAVEEDMVVSIHPTDPDDMEKLAAALPRMKPVAAHFGGYGQYEGHRKILPP